MSLQRKKSPIWKINRILLNVWPILELLETHTINHIYTELNEEAIILGNFARDISEEYSISSKSTM